MHIWRMGRSSKGTHLPKYLGVYFTKYGDSFKMVNQIVEVGYTAFRILSKIWRDRSISRAREMGLLGAINIPTATYESEN